MKTPSKLSPGSLLDVSRSTPVAGLQDGSQALHTDERSVVDLVSGPQAEAWKPVKHQKRDRDATGAEKEAIADDAGQPTNDQLSFDFGMVEGFAWNQDNSGAELSEYLAVGEDYNPDEYALFGETGSELTVAGIRPVPLVAPQEAVKEAVIEAAPSEPPAAKNEGSSDGASATTAPATQATEAKTPAPAPSAPTQDAVADQAPNAEPKSNTPSAQDGPPVWVAGFALLGLGGGGGGGGPAPAPTDTPEPTPEPTIYAYLDVTPSAGRFNNLSQLTLEAFKPNGDSLSITYDVVREKFSIRVLENYSGPVMIRVSDGDTNPDYKDEATNQFKDLNADLRVMFNVISNSANTTPVKVAVNPLTELAVQKLTGDSGGDGGSAGHVLGASVTGDQVTAVNTTIASAFDLPGDVASNVPVTVDDTASFAAGTDAAKAYGRALAAISGMEANASQTTNAVLNRLASGITGEGANATLSATLVTEYAQGVDKVVTNFLSVLDGSGPTISQIQMASSVTGTQPIAKGETFDVLVDFTERVYVDSASGQPQLPLTLTWAGGEHPLVATYVSGSGSSQLTFRATMNAVGVVEGRVTVNADSNALSLSGGDIADLMGNAAGLTHAAFASQSTYGVDTVAPSISRIALSGAEGMQGGLLNAGDKVMLTVGFSEAVQFDIQNGTPSLSLNFDGVKNAAYASFSQVSASGTSAEFVLTIGSDPLAMTNGIAIDQNALALNGGLVSDAAGNKLLISSAMVAANDAYKIDTKVPNAPGDIDLNSRVVTDQGKYYVLAANIVSLSGVVSGEANSTVVLFDQTNEEAIDFVLADGAGNWTTDLVLAEGTHEIVAIAIDSAGNWGEALSNPLTIEADRTAPFLTGFTINLDPDSYTQDTEFKLTAHASEALTAGGKIRVKLNTGDEYTLSAEGGQSVLTMQAATINAAVFDEAKPLAVTSYSVITPVTDIAGISLAKVTVSDALGNLGQVFIDKQAPTVKNVTLVSVTGAQDGWLNAGDTVYFDVEMSEVVELRQPAGTSGPTLKLNFGGKAADYYGMSDDARHLLFKYVIDAEDQSPTSDILPATGQQALVLGDPGTTLRDLAGNNANLNITNANALNDYKVLTGAPSIVSVSLTEGKAYALGETVTFSLTLSEDYDYYDHIQGTLAGFDVENLQQGADGKTFTASFTVTAGKADVPLDGTVEANLVLVDVAGNQSEAYTSGDPVSVPSGFAVDGNLPILKRLQIGNTAEELDNDNALIVGDKLKIDAVFSEAVTVGGDVSKLVLPVLIGGEPAVLKYESGSGTDTLHFVYVIKPGDNGDVAVVGDALSLSAASIHDAAGQGAIATYATLEGPSVRVDTIAPSVASFFTDYSDGPYGPGDQITIYAQMTEAVDRNSKLFIDLNSGAQQLELSLLNSPDPTSLFWATYIVGSGENAALLDVSAMDVSGVFDLAKNLSINSQLPSSNLASDGQPKIEVDSTAPQKPINVKLQVGDTGVDLTDGITNQTANLRVSADVDYGVAVELFDGTTSLGADVVAAGAGGSFTWDRVINLAEGTHQLSVKTTDAAGNVSVASDSLTVKVDLGAPLVTSVVLSTREGESQARLKAGEQVMVEVTMSEAVWLRGAIDIKPTIMLNVGGSLLEATCVPDQADATRTLQFVATVPTDWNDSNGVTVEANSLKLGTQTLTDAAGNAAELTHEGVLDSQILVDTMGPSVLSATLVQRAQVPLLWQDKVVVEVAFDEEVLVSDGVVPSLALKLGTPGSSTTAYIATYVAGSGSSTLRFEYTVGSGLDDQVGFYVPKGALNVPSGGITDVAGNVLARADYEQAIPAAETYTVVATPPHVSNVEMSPVVGMLNVGDTVSFTVTFDKEVTLTGSTAELLLDIGGQEAVAKARVPEGATKVVLFDFTVPEPDFASVDQPNLYQASSIKLVTDVNLIAPGMLTDAQGNSVDARLTTSGYTFQVPVDNVNPHVVKFSAVSPAKAFLGVGDTVVIKAELNEALDTTTYTSTDAGGHVAVMTLFLDSGESVVLYDQTGEGKLLSGTYTVAGGNSDDLTVSGITLNQVPKDSAGNSMVALPSDSPHVFNLNANYDIVVDTKKPDAPTIKAVVNDTGVSASDLYTNQAYVHISGTAEAYSRVVISEGGATLGEVMEVGEAGAWSITLANPLATGAHSLQAVAIDRANNVSPISSAIVVNVDTVKPVIESIALKNDVGPMIVDQVVTVLITLKDDASNNPNDAYYNVQGSVNGFALQDLTQTNDPNVYEATFTVAEGGSDVDASNSIAVSGVTVEDKAGNISDVASTSELLSAYKIDAHKPTIEKIRIASATGLQGGYTNAGDVITIVVEMSEEVTVGSSVPTLKLNLGGHEVEAVFDAFGPGNTSLEFTYTVQAGDTAMDGIAIPADALQLGTEPIKDLSGNIAILTSPAEPVNSSYKVDTEPPPKPVAITLMAASDSGDSETDGVTQENSTWVLSGTADPASSVLVYINDELVETVAARGGEAWTATLTSSASGTPGSFVSDATYNVSVVAQDPAGNKSEVSDTLPVTVDTKSPSIDAVGGASWAIPDEMLHNGFLSAQAGSDQVQVKLKFDEVVFVKGAPSVSLVIGTQVREALYIPGDETQELTFAYTIVSGDNDSDGIALSSAYLSLNGGSITDQAGNALDLTIQPPTAAFGPKVDTLTPNGASIASLAAADDSGFDDADAITRLQTNLSFSGTSDESGGSVLLFNDANDNGQFERWEYIGDAVTVDQNGEWAIEIATLAEGTYHLRTQVTDLAGNKNLIDPTNLPPALTLKIDVTAPPAPVQLTLDDGANAGARAPGVTKVSSGLTFSSLDVEADASIDIYEVLSSGAEVPVSYTVDADGRIVLDDPLGNPWSQGVHKFYATATDAAGNESIAGTLASITIDSTPPAQPGTISLAALDDTGISATDALTSQTSGLSFTGVAEKGAKIVLYEYNESNQLVRLDDTTEATSEGKWTLENVTLGEGTHRLVVRATDLAGNESQWSEVKTVEVDVTRPTLKSVAAWDVSADNGLYSAGDMIQLTFSEPIQVAALVAHLIGNNAIKLGVGAIVQAQDPTNGAASEFWVTLGVNPTLVVGEVLSMNKEAVLDAAGNEAFDTVRADILAATLTRPLVAATTTTLNDGRPYSAFVGTDNSDRLIGIGDRVIGQYSTAYMLPETSTALRSLVNGSGLATVGEYSSFQGGAGTDFVTLYGHLDLADKKVTFHEVEHIRILGDVTLSTSQLSALIEAGVAIDGEGRGILRIVDDSVDPVVPGVSQELDLTLLRLSNLAQIDLGAGVTVVLAQENIDQIGAMSSDTSISSTILTEAATLDWSGVSVYGLAQVQYASGTTSTLLDQVGAINGAEQLASSDSTGVINASISSANALLKSSAVSAYQLTPLDAAADVSVLWGDPTLINSLAAFGAEQHWLIGGTNSDFMQGGDLGDVFWTGDEAKYTTGVVNTVRGGDGNDIVVGGANADNIETGAGDDYIFAGGYRDKIAAGLGNDYIRSGSDASDWIVFDSYLKDDGSRIDEVYGVDLFDAGIKGDQLDFSALNQANGFGDRSLNNDGLYISSSAAVVKTALANVSSDAAKAAAVVVLTDTGNGQGLGHYDPQKIDFSGLVSGDLGEWSRIAVWRSEVSMVDMAFVRSFGGQTEAVTFAHLMLNDAAQAESYLLGLQVTDFIF